MKFYLAVVSFFYKVPVLSQAFFRCASTQYRRVPAHFKPCFFPLIFSFDLVTIQAQCQIFAYRIV